MTLNLNEVLNQATKKIAGLIQKSMNKNSIESKIGRATEDLESLIRQEDFWSKLYDMILMLNLSLNMFKYVKLSI